MAASCKFTSIFSPPEVIQLLDVSHFFNSLPVRVSLLRLDNYSALLSGNKFFKLKYNIEHALEQNYTHIISFGGAHSNHLYALASLCKQLNLPGRFFIRGEQPPLEKYSPTLRYLQQCSIELHFMSRQAYQQKNDTEFLLQLKKHYPDAYIIPEGGSNALALKGAADIARLIYNITDDYSHIACAIGTAATCAGIASQLSSDKSLLAFSALKISEGHLKNMFHEQLQQSDLDYQCSVHYYDMFHCGGYAKVNSELMNFVAAFECETGVELDYVYVAKMLYGLQQLIKRNTFENDAHIIAIHTGGLQGRQAILEKFNKKN